MGLNFDIAPLSEKETKYRQIDVLDVTGIADIKIKSHLESPFCKNDPYIEQIYADFLEELKPKTKPSVSVPSLAPPEETNFHEAGLVAKYFSLEENQWVLVKYSYIEKVELQRNYVQLARSICQSGGVWKDRVMAQRMVSFLLYLFFKKRRSDVICRNCKVYESRFVRTSFLSALAKSSSIEVTDENTHCLISKFANPKWSPLKDGDTKACKLVDKNGIISFKVFMRLVKDLIYNIAFDGDEQSPVEHLFRIILAERRNYQNHNMIKAIASNTFIAGRGMKLPIDTNRHIHPSYLKIVPRKLFNFQKLYKCNFINDLICFEELQNYIILHSILKFVTEKDSPSIPKPRVASASLRSLMYRRTELKEDSMYRLVDRTKLERLLNNEVVVLPPVRLDLLLSQEVKAFYKCSTDWFKIFSYLIKKSEKAILLYNEFWDFYKTKLHNIETGKPIDKVFPNNFECRGLFFNKELAINLKTYIKYSITILEHFLRLKSYLIELYLLYSVKPKFLQYEAFYIIRHSLPKFDAHTSTDGYFKVINFLEDLKRYKWKIRRHQRQIRTSMKQVTGSMAESSSRIEVGEEKLKTNLNIFNSPSSVGIPGGMLSQASHFESILSISDPSAYQPGDPFNPKTILKKTKLELKLKRKEREVLTLLLAAREKCQDGSSNTLRDFEDVFLLNSQFWINYSEITDLTVYNFCESIYEEIITVLKNSLTEDRGKTFDEQCPRNLKDYPLKKMMKSIKRCIKHYAHRIKAIYCNLRMLNSDYTKRPLDYYERLYGCYVAIYNLLNAIMELQENFPTVLPPESIKELKIKFPSLHIVNV